MAKLRAHQFEEYNINGGESMTRIFVYTRVPGEKYWIGTKDGLDASKVDLVCRNLKKAVEDGNYYLRIEVRPE